jgi:hypothetical protein
MEADPSLRFGMTTLEEGNVRESIEDSRRRDPITDKNQNGNLCAQAKTDTSRRMTARAKSPPEITRFRPWQRIPNLHSRRDDRPKYMWGSDLAVGES